MSAQETDSRSPLDKPLHQLTEDDISQLTREDCRRYLKSKGMRRPSWNKSQAIQQVISLKTLLERTSDSATADAATTVKKFYIPSPENPHRVPFTSPASAKVTAADTRISVSAEDLASYRRKDPEKPDLHGNLSGGLAAADNDSVSPRTTCLANMPLAQMTIFYCGKVNAYDDMPSDKARAIMQLAASPFHFPQEASSDGVTVFRSSSCLLQAASAKVAPSPPMIFQTLQSVKMTENISPLSEENVSREDNLGPTSRKASVQRYLEKRKDRFKSKRKVGIPSSGSLDVYLNHRIGETPNEQLSGSDACSPQPRPPHTPTRCSSVENRAKNANLSSNLNEPGIHEQ
ncbi:protein TIFY 4B-like isoform X2 [Malania oleifera]|uniref:protein TIFY 4B-like isoform X2 n=1 Tax=Malania oleifera TaxID=397392 RepID=UPI0025ADB067|nr:protein TIFY 4B-like isoform X2 [Malania oleifera]